MSATGGECKKQLQTMDGVDLSLSPLLRFNVDCDASAGLYGAAEGAFGSSGGGFHLNPNLMSHSKNVFYLSWLRF